MLRMELEETFSRHLDAGGMSFCVYRQGEPLLRLGGSGLEPDDLTVIFSGTKGLLAAAAARLMERGDLDADAPVAQYWPEFAQAGKEQARVRHLLSHTVGLPYVEDPPPGRWGPLDSLANAQALAEQASLWPEGERVAYHPITYGYLAGELLRRITGRTPGELIRELADDAAPGSSAQAGSALDLWLGLPEDQHHRMKPVLPAPDYAPGADVQNEETARALDAMYGSTVKVPGFFTSPELYRAELAGAGGIASADALACFYSQLISAEVGVVGAETLSRATEVWAEGTDALTGSELRFGLGFELYDWGFGHSGAGGGLHGAIPDAGIGFSFLTTQMLPSARDVRAQELVETLRRSL